MPEVTVGGEVTQSLPQRQVDDSCLPFQSQEGEREKILGEGRNEGCKNRMPLVVLRSEESEKEKGVSARWLWRPRGKGDQRGENKGKGGTMERKKLDQIQSPTNENVRGRNVKKREKGGGIIRYVALGQQGGAPRAVKGNQGRGKGGNPLSLRGGGAFDKRV